MDKLQYIRENEQLNILLMNECDIYFYKETGYSCGGFNTPTLCVVTKGIKADCNHLMRTYSAKH